jgi:hypothetical protein
MLDGAKLAGTHTGGVSRKCGRPGENSARRAAEPLWIVSVIDKCTSTPRTSASQVQMVQARRAATGGPVMEGAPTQRHSETACRPASAVQVPQKLRRALRSPSAQPAEAMGQQAWLAPATRRAKSGCGTPAPGRRAPWMRVRPGGGSSSVGKPVEATALSVHRDCELQPGCSSGQRSSQPATAHRGPTPAAEQVRPITQPHRCAPFTASRHGRKPRGPHPAAQPRVLHPSPPTTARWGVAGIPTELWRRSRRPPPRAHRQSAQRTSANALGLRIEMAPCVDLWVVVRAVEPQSMTAGARRSNPKERHEHCFGGAFSPGHDARHRPSE